MLLSIKSREHPEKLRFNETSSAINSFVSSQDYLSLLFTKRCWLNRQIKMAVLRGFELGASTNPLIHTTCLGGGGGTQKRKMRMEMSLSPEKVLFFPLIEAVLW